MVKHKYGCFDETFLLTYSVVKLPTLYVAGLGLVGCELMSFRNRILATQLTKTNTNSRMVMLSPFPRLNWNNNGQNLFPYAYPPVSKITLLCYYENPPLGTILRQLHPLSILTLYLLQINQCYCTIPFSVMKVNVSQTVPQINFCVHFVFLPPIRRSQWPHGLRRELSSLARTRRSWVRIPFKVWMFVCVYSVFVCR
jgi:hypothetical protein